MILLIADDLKSVHRFLENCAEWDKLGIDEILHTYDGRECIEITKKTKPDIMLLDIRMPICDGLGVLKELSEGNYMPKVIIISAYSDFDYAKQMFRYDVVDYLLKPINVSTLLAVISEIVSNIRKQCLLQLRSYLLDLPFEGYQMDITFVLEKMHLNEGFCVLIRLNGNMARIEEVIQNFEESYKLCIQLSKKELLIIDVCSKDEAEKRVAVIVEKLQDIKTDEGLQLIAGVSSVVQLEKNNLQKAYNQCLDAINRHFYVEGVVFVYDAFARNGNIDIKCVNQYKMQISQCLLDEQNNDLELLVDKMFNDLTSTMPNQREIVDVCYNILTYSINYLFFSYKTIDPESTGHLLLHELDVCSNIEQLKKAFIRILISRIPDETTLEKTTYNERMIHEVKDYVRENYSQALTLESISAEFFISKYELCRKFKAYVGENLWEYIQKIRINKAKELLLKSEMKVYEISHAVGYNDPTYFSNSFKRFTGMSPAQYKNNHYGRES